MYKIGYADNMALNNTSKSIRVYFDGDDADTRIRFKQLAARADTPMSRRAADLMKLDIAYWEVTGEILDLSQLDTVVGKLSNKKNGDSKEANGHHAHSKSKSSSYESPTKPANTK